MVGASKARVEVPWLLILALLLSPAAILLYYFSKQEFGLDWNRLDVQEIWWATKNSIALGTFSAFFSIFLGIFLALGLNHLSIKYPRLNGLLQQALLFPIYLPPFFVILIFFYWLDFAPMGLAASSVAQVLCYAGFAGVLIRSIFNQNLAGLSELAMIQGISQFRFFWISRALLYRPFFALSVFIFAMSFSSFSIPLVLGGGKGTTLEILVYEKIKISQDFGAAFILGALQSLFLAIIYWKLPMDFSLVAAKLPQTRFLSSRWAALGLLIFMGVQFVPWFGQTPAQWEQGWRQISEAPEFWSELFWAALQSGLLSLVVMFLAAGLAMVYLYLMVSRPVPSYVRSYFPLSVSLIGLSGVFLGAVMGIHCAYLLSFLVLSFPSLFRLGLESKVEELRGQLQVAEVMGAPKTLIFRRILLPQTKNEFSLLMGMAFLWTLGDFAVARFFLPSGATIPLLIDNLMTSYRIQGALMLGVFVLLAGGAMQLLLWRVLNVDHSRS